MVNIDVLCREATLGILLELCAHNNNKNNDKFELSFTIDFIHVQVP